MRLRINTFGFIENNSKFNIETIQENLKMENISHSGQNVSIFFIIVYYKLILYREMYTFELKKYNRHYKVKKTITVLSDSYVASQKIDYLYQAVDF